MQFSEAKRMHRRYFFHIAEKRNFGLRNLRCIFLSRLAQIIGNQRVETPAERYAVQKVRTSENL